MNAAAPSTNYGWRTFLWWDGPLESGDWIAMRFGLDSITSGMSVVSASLSYFVMNGGDTAEVFYLTCPWSEDTVTWGNINSGSTFTEAACMGSKIADAPGSTAGVRYSVDVTAAVQYWLANPSANTGIIFKPSGGNNGVGILTTERSASDGPALSVTVTGTVPSPPPAAPMGSFAVTAFEDTQLNSGSVSTNYGSEVSLLFDGPMSGGDYVVLKPDLSSAAHLASIMTSAKLRYYVTNRGDDGKLYELGVPWSQDTATWDNFNNGATYDSSVVGAYVGIASGAYPYTDVWQEVDVTSSVTKWLANPSANNGWVIQPEGGNDGCIFSSAESASHPPEIVFAFPESQPSPPPIPSPPPYMQVVLHGGDLADTQITTGSSQTFGSAITLLWDGPVTNGDWILVKPDLSKLSAADTIVSAVLEHNNFNAGDNAQVYELTLPWDESNVTFSTLPYSQAARGTHVGSASGSHGWQTLGR